MAVCFLCSLAASFARAEPGDELAVYHVAIGRGDAIFEKFGHNGIRILDRSTGEDVMHHWGLFDFRQRRFFINFALGHLNYSMATDDYAETVAWYRHLNRSIRLQELNLTAVQKLALRKFCEWNQRDENRFYAYNYYTDNCSTRVRDALDRALDGMPHAQLDLAPTGTTFRWHTRRLTQDSVFWYTLLNTVLGPATDRPITRWEECFLPLRMAEHLKSVTINGGPLIVGEEMIFPSTRPPDLNVPPQWLHWYILAGMATGGVIVWLGWKAARAGGGRRWRIAFGVVVAAWAVVIGVAGWFGLWTWIFSAHWAAWRNVNMFAYSPLALPLAVDIPLMFRGRPRARTAALWLAVAVAASTLIGLVLSPMLPQVIREPMALALPINLALGFAIWRYVRSAEGQADKS